MSRVNVVMKIQVGETRVICNPYGYHGHEVNREFDNKLVVEI